MNRGRGIHGSQLQGMLSVPHMCCCEWLQAAKRQARYSQSLSENSIKFGVPCLFQPKNRVLFLDTPSGSLTRHGPLVMRSITMRHGPLGTSIGGSWESASGIMIPNLEGIGIRGYRYIMVNGWLMAGG